MKCRNKMIILDKGGMGVLCNFDSFSLHLKLFRLKSLIMHIVVVMGLVLIILSQTHTHTHTHTHLTEILRYVEAIYLGEGNKKRTNFGV